MAAMDRKRPAALAALLEATPQRFELTQALLLLERLRPGALPLGQGDDPRREAVRIKGPLTPGFAANQIDELELDAEHRPVLHTPVFGLGGPDGPLPYAYQEWLQQRSRIKDSAPAEFLDLFQHRLLSLLYRIDLHLRPAVGFQPPEQSPLQLPLKALVGLAPAALQGRQRLADSAFTARVALFGNSRRSLAGFINLVRQHFRVPAQAQPFVGAWKPLPAANRSQLARGGSNLCLGRDALLGTHIWDDQAGVQLELGPLAAIQGEAFLPGGARHTELVALWVCYFGTELGCRLHLHLRGAQPMVLARQAAPRFGRGARLLRAAAAELLHTLTLQLDLEAA